MKGERGVGRWDASALSEHVQPSGTTRVSLSLSLPPSSRHGLIHFQPRPDGVFCTYIPSSSLSVSAAWLGSVFYYMWHAVIESLESLCNLQGQSDALRSLCVHASVCVILWVVLLLAHPSSTQSSSHFSAQIAQFQNNLVIGQRLDYTYQSRNFQGRGQRRFISTRIQKGERKRGSCWLLSSYNSSNSANLFVSCGRR